jgi:hypothetical protein
MFELALFEMIVVDIISFRGSAIGAIKSLVPVL